MAQTGILDYQRYLNTLQTLNYLGQTFPSNQQTYNFTVAGGGTASWPATISWETLILDKVSFSSKETGYIPNVDNSQVIGYFEGSTATQYSSGVISLPANMYTGPILPGGDYHVPLTVVHIEWFDGVTTYAQQIGFIQNWEPGVELGDPTISFDYFAVYGLPSNLTLTGIPGLIYGDDLVLTATTDIPLDLGTTTRVRFYQKAVGGDILVGTAYFVGKTATFSLTTIGNFSIGVYDFYAVSSAFRNYLKATSNDFNVRVAAGVPLIVNTSTFDPNKAYYFPGDNVTYNLGVYADPAFTATGVAISNTLTVTLINGFPPNTETVAGVTNFVNGQAQIPFTIQAGMIDSARIYPETSWSITTSTQNTTTYTATLFVSNTETVTSVWNSQYAGRYAAGSTSTSIQVANTTQVTVVADAFPISITQSSTNTFVTEEFIITVTTPNVAYYNTLTIYAQKDATIESLYSGNFSGSGSFTASVYISSSTGTWTLYASYPGDLGMSLINANLPSTSNSLSHVIRNGNELLPPPILNFYRTPDNDILEVRASTSTTLTNTVSFYEGTTLLGTAEWTREGGTFFYPAGPTRSYKTSGFARNFQTLAGVQTSSGYGGDGYVAPGVGNSVIYERYPRFWRGNASIGSVTWQDVLVSDVGSGLLDQIINNNPFDPTSRVFKIIPNNQNGKVTGVGWASPISSTSTYVDPSNNHYALNPNMKKLNQYEGGGPYAKFPNRYTLFKYYDGTNYDLSTIKSTSTDVYGIADPIEFGQTWYNNYAGLTQPYKRDTIGDSRGYNVIAIEASGVRPLSDTPEGYVETLRYNINSANTQTDIQLVEFIGTVTWSTPIIESAIWPAKDPYPIGYTGSSPKEYVDQVTAWLFKFTPEIPQGQTVFQTQYPFQEAMDKTFGLGLEKIFTNYAWQNYGKKNLGNTQTSVGGAFFNAVTNPVGTPIYTQAGVYGPSHTQTAVLILPRDSISNISNVHAVWTGTQNLNVIYGKYYGFDIYVTPSPTRITLQGYNLRDNNQLLNVATSINKDTNAVRLVANVNFISVLNPDAEVAGNVVFYDAITNNQFGVSTVTNKVATLDVYGNQLYGATNLYTATRGVQVQARFTNTNYSAISSVSTSKAITATYQAGDDYIAFNGSTSTYTNENSYTTPIGKTTTIFYGSYGVRIPFFESGSGSGSIYFRFTYSTNIGAGWSTPATLPMSPSTYNGYGRMSLINANTFKVDRNNTGDTTGLDLSFSLYNLSVPISGGGQIRVYVDVWSINAVIPTGAQVGFHDYTNFQHS